MQGRDIDDSELSELIQEAASIASSFGFGDCSQLSLADSMGQAGSSIAADASNRDPASPHGQSIGGAIIEAGSKSIVAEALAVRRGIGWVVSESIGGLSANDPSPDHAKVVRGA